MKVTGVKIRKIDKANSKLKAFAEVEFDGTMRIDNFKLIDGAKGMFVGNPSQKGPDDKYFDTVRIKDQDLIKEIATAVIKEYGGEDEDPWG